MLLNEELVADNDKYNNTSLVQSLNKEQQKLYSQRLKQNMEKRKH